MMPRTEPEAMPALYDGWTDWRASYAEYVKEYKEGVTQHPEAKTTYRVRLKNRLARLGYFGVRLEDELRYIESGGN